ncbi:hypothetical protein BV96_00089 [Sphingomonas paucimobilis]|nr:hypothetical protein BV96_00089 [Sphingomonas paucimobilis]
MNDRNAFLQGQGSPIKDDEPPPIGGWRGEKAAEESASNTDQRHRLSGTNVEVEDISGTAFAEATSLGKSPNAPDEGDHAAAPQPAGGHAGGHGDGVSDLEGDADSPGGESEGAPYPQPYRKGRSDNDFGSVMGHGGQSEIAYHGPGHLGEQDVGEDDDRNGVAKSND